MTVTNVAPFTYVEDCLVAARVITNDAAQSIAGDILADTQPFTLPMADLAHKTLRKMLTKAGVTSYSAYNYCIGLTPVQTTDPGFQVQLTYSGYYDGVNQNASPTLPGDLIEPLELWERQTGTENVWRPMKPAADSISSRAQNANFSIWDWETSILYLPGATQSNDLKMKYLQATPRLTSTTQQIPIPDCDMAMGALIAELAAVPRGAEAVAYFHSRAESEVILLATPQQIKEEYQASFRRPFRNTRSRFRGAGSR
jgi:hypothetical protein